MNLESIFVKCPVFKNCLIRTSYWANYVCFQASQIILLDSLGYNLHQTTHNWSNVRDYYFNCSWTLVGWNTPIERLLWWFYFERARNFSLRIVCSLITFEIVVHINDFIWCGRYLCFEGFYFIFLSKILDEYSFPIIVHHLWHPECKFVFVY